jgi:hypothetical protein
MTSEQVMLALLVLLLPLWGGCGVQRDARDTPVPRLVAPYAERQVWAVAPLRNESGSLHADGVRIADHLARQLERAEGIDVIPVNRVLAAMDAMRLGSVASPEDALQLRRTLGVDAIVIGTVSSYDPYDPPKLGLAVELYVDEDRDRRERVDLRGLTRAPVDEMTRLPSLPQGQPVNAVSGLFDAADSPTRQWLERYATGRGSGEARRDHWRNYRMSMDLYTEFVSYAVSWRLLNAEARRLRSGEAPNAGREKPRRIEPLS